MSVQRKFKIPYYSKELQACFSHDGFMDNDIDAQRLHPERSDAINVRLSEVPNNSLPIGDLSDDVALAAFPLRDTDSNELEQMGYDLIAQSLSANNNSKSD